MNRSTLVIMLTLTVFGCVIACHKQDSHFSNTSWIDDETDSQMDTTKMVLIDTLSISDDCVNDSDSVSEPGITYHTLKQIELKIPNAIDSIATAVSRFSPEYQNWTFTLHIYSTDPKKMILVGEPGDKWIDSILHKYFHEKIGYLTVNGIDMDFEIFHRSGNFNDLKVDSLFEYTGQSKTFKYKKDQLIIVDNCVEYHMDITPDGLTLQQKIENW